MIRVLVVDDDFRVAALHAGVVGEIDGCEVAGAVTSLGRAQQALAEGGIDLVIADQHLPDGSGVELVGTADAAVLLVTADGDAATIRRALVRGALGYIVKPFDLRLLAERVADFQRLLQGADARGRLDQARIDALFGQLTAHPAGAAPPPKGRSLVTASAVAELLRTSPEPLTALDVAAHVGTSRATAQRYLADLVAAGQAELSLRYGVSGRPQHSYAWVRAPRRP